VAVNWYGSRIRCITARRARRITRKGLVQLDGCGKSSTPLPSVPELAGLANARKAEAVGGVGNNTRCWLDPE
jgi:hypothetical protein